MWGGFIFHTRFLYKREGTWLTHLLFLRSKHRDHLDGHTKYRDHGKLQRQPAKQKKSVVGWAVVGNGLAMEQISVKIYFEPCGWNQDHPK